MQFKGKTYTLPKFTLAVAEAEQDARSAKGIREIVEKRLSFVQMVMGEKAADILGTDYADEVDIAELGLLFNAICQAFHAEENKTQAEELRKLTSQLKPAVDLIRDMQGTDSPFKLVD